MSLNCETKINVRIPDELVEKLRTLIPRKYMNESDFMRTAVRDLLAKEGL
jgi:Arc/MetJ-type ribon-helix-helix transcriptional regulator